MAGRCAAPGHRAAACLPADFRQDSLPHQPGVRLEATAHIVWAAAVGLAGRAPAKHASSLPTTVQLYLPHVIGMLAAGILMKNIPWGAIDAFPSSWGNQIRAAALATIFLRCGLELDFGVRAWPVWGGGGGGTRRCAAMLREGATLMRWRDCVHGLCACAACDDSQGPRLPPTRCGPSPPPAADHAALQEPCHPPVTHPRPGRGFL